MVKQRWNPMGVVSPGSPGLYEEQFAKALGKHAQYCITNTVWFNPKNAITQAFAAAFKKRFPKDDLAFHGINATYTFDAILIAADAFKRAKTTDPKALAEAIRQTNIAATDRVTFGGPIKFNGKGQVEGNRSVVLQNLGGKPTVVLPKEYCRGEARVSRPQTGVSGVAHTAAVGQDRRCATSPMLESRNFARRARVFSMPALSQLANVIISGALTGTVYGLMALGLSAIFGVIRLVNFAHGEFMTLAMYTAVVAFQGLALDPFVTMLVAAALFAGIGYVIQRAFINRFVHRPEHTQMLLMIALSIIIANLLLLGFGPDAKNVQTSYQLDSFELGPILLDKVRVYAAAAAVLATAVVGRVLSFHAHRQGDSRVRRQSGRCPRRGPPCRASLRRDLRYRRRLRRRGRVCHGLRSSTSPPRSARPTPCWRSSS